MESIGQVLMDRYVVRGSLGSGARGTVYAADDLHTRVRVALKVAERPEGLPMEALRSMGRLTHPNVVRVLHTSAEPPEPLVVMEWLDGAPLGPVAAPPGSTGPRTWLLDAMLQILSALEHAHERGVWHGNLHPRNVLLRFPRAGVPWIVVTDFAWPTSSRARAPDPQLAQFLAPEVRTGGTANAQTDIYSAAMLLQWTLCGDTSERARSLLPPALAPVLSRALASRPSRRQQSAAELAAELQALRSELSAAPISRHRNAPAIHFVADSSAAPEPPTLSAEEQRVLARAASQAGLVTALQRHLAGPGAAGPSLAASRLTPSGTRPLQHPLAWMLGSVGLGLVSAGLVAWLLA